MHTARPRWSYGLFPAAAALIAAGFAAHLGGFSVERILFRHADKAIHFAGYGGLAFFAVGFYARPARRLVLILMLVVLFEEWSQQFVPRRSMDLLDACCSLAGLALGGGLADRLRCRRREPQRAQPPQSRSAPALHREYT